MYCQKLINWILALVGLSLLVSCTQLEIENHVVDYNVAIGSTGSQLLLLNAARAAKGYPLQFSKVQNFLGNGKNSGSISATIPFIANTLGNPTGLIQGNVQPRIDVKPGLNQLQLVDLNTQEAQRALKRLITLPEYKYYLQQGWPKPLVDTILIRGIRITKRMMRVLYKTYYNYCEGKKDEVRCRLANVVKTCQLERYVFEENGVKYVQFVSDARRECNYRLFQWFWDTLHIANSYFRSKPLEQGELSLAFYDPHLERLWQKEVMRLKGIGMNVPPIEFGMRSAESAVRFLGDIIYSQNLAHNGFVPTTVIGEEVVEIFRVEVDANRSASLAVSIRGPEGIRFVIPVPDHGASTRHRSLTTLSLVADIVNGAVSGEELPKPSTVVISGG